MIEKLEGQNEHKNKNENWRDCDYGNRILKKKKGLAKNSKQF